MRLGVQRERCTGHAQCYLVSEELFPIDDDGRSLVSGDEVAPADEALARDGVSVCPEKALFIEGDAAN